MDNNILTVSTDLDQIFNSSKLCIKTLGVPEPHDPSRVPDIDKNYVFPLPFLNQILLYLACPLHDCLYVSGPSGCGKTTMALQVAARLGWGVEQITLSGKSESADLIGHAALRKGELVYEYGPLVRAMRNGEILILNEIDLMPPSDLAALNDVLDGKPLIIAQNCGEIIKPAPGFRVIATANTNGMGDQMGYSIRLPETEREYVSRLYSDIFGNEGADDSSTMGKSAPRHKAQDSGEEEEQEGEDCDKAS